MSGIWKILGLHSGESRLKISFFRTGGHFHGDLMLGHLFYGENNQNFKKCPEAQL